MVYHLSIDGGFNVRDLGGYPTEDGGITRKGVFVRAGMLAELTPAGKQQIIDYGVRTIVDLRGASELEMSQSSFVGSDIVDYQHLPLIGDELYQSERWQAAMNASQTLHDTYARHIDICVESICAIMTSLIESPPATAFHCYAGKDRTGMITALLLGSVGVPDAIIAQDYALTEAGVAHLVSGWRENAIKEGADMARFERSVASRAETMLELMSYIRQTYKGAANYLRSYGITDDQLGRLRARFVQYDG